MAEVSLQQTLEGLEKELSHAEKDTSEKLNIQKLKDEVQVCKDLASAMKTNVLQITAPETTGQNGIATGSSDSATGMIAPAE